MSRALVGLAHVAEFSRWECGAALLAEDAVRQTVNAAIRRAVTGAVPADAPLSEVIAEGDSVLVKPNFVKHANGSRAGIECLITSPDVLVAVVREVAAARPRRIIVGDAPLQTADFSRIMTRELADRLARAAAGCELAIADFRRTVVANEDLAGGVQRDVRAMSDYVLFDMGCDSLLEPVTRGRSRFRVTNYDPQLMRSAHGPGRHSYLIAREALEADVVISVPKLKTHRKVGMTCCLKNLVGINGNKDYLPHHRLGGTRIGGDCYPGASPFKLASELFLDTANRHLGEARRYSFYKSLARLFLKLGRRFGGCEFEGSWYGNDTCWRMCLDLNRILRYGRLDGTLAPRPVRNVFCVVDALVAGHGEGPLEPVPLELGCILAGRCPASTDWTAALLLGMQPARVPLLANAFGRFPYPVTTYSSHDIEIHAGPCSDPIASYGKSATLPSGWLGYEQRLASAWQSPCHTGRRKWQPLAAERAPS